MATYSSATDHYNKQIDSLLAVLDNSSLSGDEEASDLTGSAISSKSKKEANRLDRWRVLEVELKEHYLTNLKEKKAIIEERKCFMNEKMRFIEEKNRFMIEKIQLIEEKNQVLEEKCRVLEEKESEMRNENESLKRQLEEAMGQNKKLTDQLKKEQVEDRKRLEKELSEKDDQAKKLKKQQAVSDYFSPKDYPKYVWIGYDRYYDGELRVLGVQLAQLSGGGVYLSSVKPGSRADLAGLRVGKRLLEVNGVSLRKATIEKANLILRQYTQYPSDVTMLVDVPEHL